MTPIGSIAPAADVLAFLARRIESDHVFVLVATREEHPLPFADAGLPEHRIGVLDPATGTQPPRAAGWPPSSANRCGKRAPRR